MRLTAVATVLALCCAGSASSGKPARTRAVSLAGTYSNLTYNEEGGDLLGMEVTIVPWNSAHYRAAVLVSEGSPTQMTIVEVRVENGTISFDAPATGPDAGDGFAFRGKLADRKLTGSVTYASGAQEQVTLVKRCGHWDR